MVGFRYGCAGRHGLPYPAPRVQGAETGLADQGGGQFDAAAERVRSLGTAREVHLPGPRQHAEGGHARSRGALV